MLHEELLDRRLHRARRVVASVELSQHEGALEDHRKALRFPHAARFGEIANPVPVGSLVRGGGPMDGVVRIRELDVSPGYEAIEIEMDIQADCSDEEVDELLAYAEGHSPVCNTVCRPVPVTLRRA